MPGECGGPELRRLRNVDQEGIVQLSSPIKNNPNATVGAGGGFLAIFVTWLAGSVFHWQISAESGAIIATAITTVALLVGRNGVRGLANIVWNGNRGGDRPDPAAPTH
ncbi:MAG: hypothetical protein ACXVRJ_06575 [Gaiellaceae bacterium]